MSRPFFWHSNRQDICKKSGPGTTWRMLGTQIIQKPEQCGQSNQSTQVNWKFVDRQYFLQPKPSNFNFQAYAAREPRSGHSFARSSRISPRKQIPARYGECEEPKFKSPKNVRKETEINAWGGLKSSTDTLSYNPNLWRERNSIEMFLQNRRSLRDVENARTTTIQENKQCEQRNRTKNIEWKIL